MHNSDPSRSGQVRAGQIMSSEERSYTDMSDKGTLPSRLEQVRLKTKDILTEFLSN